MKIKIQRLLTCTLLVLSTATLRADRAADLRNEIIPPGYTMSPPLHQLPGSFNSSSPTGNGYTPQQLLHAYGFDQLDTTGAGQIIAIVDAYGSPTIQADLNTFCTAFNLPSTTVRVYYPQGQPPTNSGWATETSLDVEWAHAIAPGATMVLVVAKSNSYADLLAAIDYAVGLGATQVSMSWGGSEWSAELTSDYHFNVPGVTFLASSGDYGASVEYPACSPDVVGVGGTTLQLDSSDNITSETAWSGSGGGVSAYEWAPSYQVGWWSGATRGVPDVAYDADPSTGVPVYQTSAGWGQWGGTSIAAPQWAALFALANSLRSQSISTAPGVLYSLATANYAGYYNDITSGGNGYTALPGYDLVTGLGTPIASNLVLALAGGFSSQVAAPVFIPGAGTYSSAQNVTILSATPGASIRYTTDGSRPTETTGTPYSGPVNVSNTTLAAIAYESGHTDSAVTSGIYTIGLQVATPTFSPAAGTYTSAQTVTISTTTPGAFIRYTTDGSTATETSGTLYSGPVSISSTTTLNVIAYEAGYIDSPITTGFYTLNFPPAAAPVFNPPVGTYITNGMTVTLTSATSGTVIAYTTDGSTPTESGGTVTNGTALSNGGSVVLSVSTDLSAIAYESGFADSPVASGVYFIYPPRHTVAPVFSPPAGVYASAQMVKISSMTSGVSIRYTTDGSTPSETYGLLYSGPVSISSTTTLSAIAYEAGFPDSAVTSGIYTIAPPAAAPVFSPAAGAYAGAQNVTITSATSGATICYTTDGSTPTETNGTQYSGPVSISSTTALKAIAYKGGFADSPVTSGLYTIGSLPAASVNVLYNFTAVNNGGIYPATALVQGSDGNFYGTTPNGGGNNYGTVFMMTPVGVLTTLVSFDFTNGAFPNAALMQGSDGNFYGTAQGGGTGGGVDGPFGTVFKMTPAGVLTTLASFDGTNGDSPLGALIEDHNGNVYGTASGLDYSNGAVFEMTPAGALTALVLFDGTNGAYPLAGLVQGNDGNFYGTTSGEFTNCGTVFKMTPAGALTTLVSFDGYTGDAPVAALVQGSDGNFYGTTSGETLGDEGTVFKMTPAGVLTTLVSFDGYTGDTPVAALIQGRDGNFYGTTAVGGSGGYGTVFKVTPAGALTTLVSFDGANGAYPESALVQGSDGNLYGTAVEGGVANDGVVFQVIIAPAAAPTFNPPGGTYASAQSVSISTTTPGASIRYTTDGSTPTETSGTLYSGPVSISNTTVLKAIAYEPGYGDSPVTSESYTINVLNDLYNFTDSSDGDASFATLVQGSDGNFYGTTEWGGNSNDGTVFMMTPAGVETTLFSFDGANGASPQAGLVQGSDGNFYGTAHNGGYYDYGTVFQITPGGVMTTLVSFNFANGAYPFGALVQGSDGNFYGTTAAGGSGDGTVFKLSQTGGVWTLTTLVSFDGANGQNPSAGLVQGSDGNFYGTTEHGGSGGDGTVFKLTPTGVLTTLVAFNGPNGALPFAGLVEGSDGNFYGTTYEGGSGYGSMGPGNQGDGTVFKVTPAGVLTTLVSFDGTNGAGPLTGVVQGDDGNFYGTTDGNYTTNGTDFQITPAGVLTTLDSFTGANGADPIDLILGTGANIYGTTEHGGSSDDGVIFQLTVPPPQVAAPVFGPTPPFTYPAAMGVTIATITPGATIRYTTDGSTPSETQGTIYSSAIIIYSTTTIKAIAYENGYSDSLITSGVYTITGSQPE